MKIIAQVTALVTQLKSEVKHDYSGKEPDQKINTAVVESQDPTNQYAKNSFTLLNPDNALVLGDAVQIVVTTVDPLTISEVQEAAAPVGAIEQPQ